MLAGWLAGWPLQVAEQCHRHEARAYLRELVFEDAAQRMLWNDQDGLEVWLGAKAAAHPTFATALGESVGGERVDPSMHATPSERQAGG